MKRLLLLAVMISASAIVAPSAQAGLRLDSSNS